MIKARTTDYMTSTRESYSIPSDVTEASTLSERRGISEDLIASVQKTEKSFEDALQDIRISNYLPTQYISGTRSNLHKQVAVKSTMHSETDKLLGSITSPGSYIVPNIHDDDSIRTDEQSQWSKATYESKHQMPQISGVLPAEIVESKITNDEPKMETSKHDSLEIENGDDVPIDHIGCERLKMEIHKNLKLHRLACDYFRFRNFLFFQVSQAILAMASSILAFMGGSDIFESVLQKQFTTIAGCCSALVVFLQTLSGYCAYGLRASMHNSTAIYLRDLDDDLTLLMSKLVLTERKQNENEEAQQQKLQNNEDTFESLQSRYRHSLKGCKSDVPTKITEAFSEVDSFILLSRTKTNRKYLRECGMFESQNFRGITLKSYDRLASNMVGYFYWPLRIPCSKMLVKRTIDETRYDLHQMNTFWETPPPKQQPMLCLPFGIGASDKNIPKFVAL